jgi:hypothetical protein
MSRAFAALTTAAIPSCEAISPPTHSMVTPDIVFSMIKTPPSSDVNDPKQLNQTGQAKEL